MINYKLELATTFNENKKWVGRIFSSTNYNPEWQLEYEVHCNSEFEMYQDIKTTIKVFLEDEMESIEE